MSRLPTGTVTFLFADIEGSTRLLQSLGDRYAQVLVYYRQLLDTASQKEDGHEVDSQGDAIFIAFPRAKVALAAAVAAQRSIVSCQWPDGVSVRVRMGLHTGEPLSTNTGYVGMDVHRAARICALAHGGQILLSQTTRDLVEPQLPKDITLRDMGPHRLKDLARPEHLFQLLHPDLPTVFPPLKSLDSLPHNLPIQLTSFVGREREIAELTSRVASARLLTLTGAGGCGKTRLALHVAAELLGNFTDGVWLVELAPLTDPASVPQAVTSALGVREEQGLQLLPTLADYLRSKHVLLVLDNCEHLIQASAELSERLLQACPHLRILATSREPLRIAGEAIWPVPPLSSPDPEESVSVEELDRYEAIRLFLDRARLRHPRFALTPLNALAVEQVCHRLDGIPLALELAAARVGVLSVEQIAGRLDDQFRLLSGSSRTAPPRHQTLGAVLDWSYQLLTDPERGLLTRLSVFAGGWTLEAAEAICGPGKGLEFEMIGLLSELVDKSLVLAEERGGKIRYRLLEMVRQYARESLLALSEELTILRKHRDWYLSWATNAARQLRGPDQRVWLERFAVEHDNLRAALDWSIQRSEADTALRLAGTLWRFWDVRGYLSEGRRWLERALEVNGETRPTLRADILNAAGLLAWEQSDLAAASRLLEESLTIHRDRADRPKIAITLNNLGNVASDRGDYVKARALHEEALAIRQELEDKRGIASSLNNLGTVVRAQGDQALARSYFEQSLAIKREAGDKGGIAISLNNLGNVAATEHDYALARAFHTEALAIRRELGDKRGIASSLTNLANVARDQGDYVIAHSLYAESLMLLRELGVKAQIAQCLEGMAGLACEHGEYQRAAQLFSAAVTLRETIRTPLSPIDRLDYARRINTVRTTLGPEAFGAAWAAGRAMTLEQVVEYALRNDDVIPSRF